MAVWSVITMSVLAAVTNDEPARGWAGPIALLVAAALFWYLIRPIGEWIYSKIENSSPTPALPPPPRVTPQDNTAVDPVDPPAEPASERPWWGRRIRLKDGSTIVRQVAHIARTGNSVQPDDDEIDLDLDEPDETLEEWIARADVPGVGYNDLVRQGAAAFGVSQSTVKNRIREHRARTGQDAA
jgi:hypothetical protein